jgi:predicted DNA binding CopG/RHH family protein
MKFYNTDEKEFIESFEKTKWSSKQYKVSHYKKLAEKSLKKTERINIRITMKDLKDIKKIAALEGIPYQTLISSILHKYARKRLLNDKELLAA